MLPGNLLPRALVVDSSLGGSRHAEIEAAGLRCSLNFEVYFGQVANGQKTKQEVLSASWSREAISPKSMRYKYFCMMRNKNPPVTIRWTCLKLGLTLYG